MSTTKELSSAIQAVAAHRSSIVNSLRLDPRVFDSWMTIAQPSNEKPADQHSLMIISTWIAGLPELDEARRVILHACSRADRAACPR